jgi:ABC-2 type transport system permease protein
MSPEEGMGKMDILFLCASMNLVLVSSFIVAMLIAEEKEKNTMRTLLLSGVTSFEFLAGKMIITLLISEFTSILMFFIIDIDRQYFGIYILVTTLVIICMIELGAMIGLIAPNQMSTGVVGMPILLVLFLLPVLAILNDSIKKIAEFIPIYNFKVILDTAVSGEPLGTVFIRNISVILVWIVLSAFAFLVTYHKVGLDK